ncbi:S1C family serine protease [Methylobacterium sp. A54F]
MTRTCRSSIAGAAMLAAASMVAAPSHASPAPPNLTVDRTFGKVAGWSIGYSESVGGCLAAATYGDGTTMWFGIGGTRGTSYVAFTNPKWRSIEVGGQYDLQMSTTGQGKWRGTFTGFERGDARGLFQSGLRERFVADLSNAGAIGIVFGGRQIATLSLVGSTEAFDAVLGCQKEATAASARTAGPAITRDEAGGAGKGSQGTGFYVSQRGHVMTNHHVIEGCGAITVSHVGAPPIRARLVASDAANDLAVLSTDASPPAVPPLAIRARVGEAVFAYGFPLNGILATSGNFTMGNVTATAGLADDTSRIQVSVPVQPGNSGGPLVDQYGNVVGVIVSKLNALRLASVTSDLAQNVNFAIKTTTALNFLEANGIDAVVAGRGSEPMDAATIAEKAKTFTVRVNCS